jgi:hypothetical protein
MNRLTAVVVLALASAGAAAKAEELKLPAEVTPQLRAACEGDVRRLCIGSSPTVAKVKSCVAEKFFQLGKKCQIELASAGLSR